MTGIIANILSFIGLAQKEATPIDSCPPELVQQYCNCSSTYTVMFWTLLGLVILVVLYQKSKKVLNIFIGLISEKKLF